MSGPAPTVYEATAQEEGRRLDRVLKRLLPGLGLSAIYADLRKGKITLNGRRAEPDARLTSGDRIELRGDTERGTAAPEGTQPAAVLDEGLILYEDEHYLVLNKPKGRVVHGVDSLASEVLAYLGPRLPASLAFIPGPLHRLDRGTSGTLFFSKSIRAATEFAAAQKAGRIEKRYLAVFQGTVPGAEDWVDRLRREGRRTLGSPQGSAARCRVAPIALTGSGKSAMTLAWVILGTGRTHQIRAQGALRGRPLLGDRPYGGSHRSGTEEFFLHAREYRVADEAGRTVVAAVAPLPAPFTAFVGRNFDLRALASIDSGGYI